MKKYWELFTSFFKIGIITFGGGYAMISHLEEIIVKKKQWLSDNELLEIIAIAEVTPGPVAINLATFIGYKRGKYLGSALATFGVILAPFIVIFAISFFLEKFLDNVIISYLFAGIKAAVVVLIVRAGINLLRKLKKNAFNIVLFVVFLVLILTLRILKYNISPIAYILTGALLGLLFTFPGKEKKNDIS